MASAKTGALALAGMVAFADPAYPYLDPGTGSLLLQGLIGALAAAAAALALAWRNMKDYVARFLFPRRAHRPVGNEEKAE
jgi:hypothetical protein